jgi:hypothetical protein
MTAAFFSPRLESIQFGYQLDFIQHLIARPKVDDASIVAKTIQ